MSGVTIRALRRDDAEAAFAAARESIDQVYPWLAWCHPGYEIEETVQWLAHQVQQFERRIEFQFAIVDRDGGYLGGIGLNQINAEHRFANLGYWVRTAAAGRGVASSAVPQLASWAFANTELARLEIVAAVGNVASQRVAERAGAQREGVARQRLWLHGVAHDAVVYSLVRPATTRRR